MFQEIPELYEIARQITHDAGMDWYDPRTGVKYPAPKTTNKPEEEQGNREQ